LALELEESGYAGLGIADEERRSASYDGRCGTNRRLAPAIARDAFQRFQELGFPTTHDEEWRFTNVAPIARLVGHAFSLPIQRIELPSEALPYLGKYAPFQNHAFVALNTAFFQDVTYIHIPRGQVVEQPIQIAYGASFRGLPPPHAHRGWPRRPLHHRRNLLRHGRLLHQRGHGNRRRQRLGCRSLQGPARIFFRLPRRRHVRQFGPQRQFLGPPPSRSAAPWSATKSPPLFRKATDATLNGLYLVNGRQHVDNHTSIDHAMPHGTSHELYKGILATRPAPSSTAASSSARTRRRPTPSRPTRTWCSPTRRSSIPSPSCKSSPTTCVAPTAPPSASWMPNPCFYLQSRGHRQTGCPQPADIRLRAGHRRPHQSSIPEGFARADPLREIP